MDIRKWFGLRQNLIEAWVFDNVVLMVTIKLPNEITSKRRLRDLQKSQLRPGSILIKYFRHIASTDLHMLFPKVRVVMSLYDKLTIAVPALAGGIPLIANLLPTLTVLFLVAGFYLGLTGPVAHEQVVKAFAALSGLAALGALIMRQRLNTSGCRSNIRNKSLTTSISATSATMPVFSTISSARPRSRNAKKPSLPITSCSLRAPSG